ncbi:membrane protein FxsA [Afifella sp. H1R]|uniref:FxsA family protein n=1 Tax=Afifella sp. H1R TaxID=2908841 RepID=UPI001F42647B|nr:FxsA family protein [Afifella sp. H1R]MCF1505118.1 membrane protein FxsA [Afifella sp. H1R]
MPIFLLLLLIPLIEVGTFVVVGQYIGLAPTLLLTLLTAILGTALLRHQGLRTILRIRSDLESGRMPARNLADGALIAVAGVMLLTPGFVTDTLGFLLFVPAVRARIWQFILSRVDLRVVGTQSYQSANYQSTRRGPNGETVVDLDEGEFEVREIDPDQNRRR